MNAALLVSVVVLWIAVVVLALVVYALARQLGVLYERVAPAGALLLAGGPTVGELAPPVDAETLDGKAATIGGASADDKSVLVFFLSASCPVCKTLLPALRSIARKEASWLRVVLAGDGAREEHEAFARAERLESFQFVLGAKLGITYQVSKLPYAVLLDASGVLRAKGLVNTREHLESLFEASERGVASIQAYLDRDGRRSAEVA